MKTSKLSQSIRVLVVNPKGGVGKTVCAQQIACSYLHYRFQKKIPIFEYDLENQDTLSSLNRSETITVHPLKSVEDLRNFVDNIDSYEALVMDVGGNKSARDVLDELFGNGDLDTFTTVVIPLTDGEQDALNAFSLYQEIRNNSDKIKVVFALCKVDHSWPIDVQFISFLGDHSGYIGYRNGYLDDIKEDDRNLICIPYSEPIKLSRYFGKTAYELSLTAEQDIVNAEKKAMVEAEKGNEKEKIKWRKRKRLANLSRDFVNNVLIKDVFVELDKYLGYGE